MLSDDQILKRFRDFQEKFLDGWAREWWIRNEVQVNYAVVEGDVARTRLLAEAAGSLDKRNFGATETPNYYINKVQPVVDAISGFQIQNRTEAEYSPRQVDEIDAEGSELVNDGVDYIYQDSNAAAENSLAFRDMLICGIGATDTTISYDENPLGEVEKRRIAPYMLMWDVAARKKNLLDANEVASAELVQGDAYLEEINEDLPEGQKIASLASTKDRFMEYFEYYTDDDDLALAYTYQWREREPYYQVQNTILNHEYAGIVLETLQNMGAFENMKARGFDPLVDEVFNIDIKEHGVFKKAFEQAGLEFKAVKHKTYRYYRAVIAGDHVVKKSENYAQNGFSLKFMTGKWSETRQCFYGVVRAAKQAQFLLNKAVSDFADALYVNPQGGVIIERDAIPGDLTQFVETWSKMRNVTIVESGALSSGKVQLKPVADAPPAAIQAINFAQQAIYETVGVTPEFMGLADGAAQQAARLQSQRVRQALTVLAPYTDAASTYAIQEGYLHVEALKTLSENTNGLVIRRISGSKNRRYAKIVMEDISSEYDIIIKEVPKTIDERERQIELLLQLSEMLTASGRDGGALAPMIVEDMNLPSSKLETIRELMTPPPPQQPDPLTTDILVSEAAEKMSRAALNKANTMLKNLEALERQQKLAGQGLEAEKTKEEIQKIKSETMENYVQSGGTLKDFHESNEDA